MFNLIITKFVYNVPGGGKDFPMPVQVRSATVDQEIFMLKFFRVLNFYVI